MKHSDFVYNVQNSIWTGVMASPVDGLKALDLSSHSSAPHGATALRRTWRRHHKAAKPAAATRPASRLARYLQLSSQTMRSEIVAKHLPENLELSSAHTSGSMTIQRIF
jgi:hypothetical protein